MSEVVFSKLTSFSTIELVSSNVEVEEYCVDVGLSSSVQQIVRSIENGKFSDGFMQLYLYDGCGEESDIVGVGYIEDWRAMCFPSDVVDSESKRKEHMRDVREERLDTLKEETQFSDSWNVLLDERDMMDGGGRYGQAQFFAVKPGVVE